MKRRGCLIAVLVVLVVVVGAAAIGGYLLLHKEVDQRWTSCDVGGRDVRAISVTEEGWLFVAANEAGHGDVWRSDDQCRSFLPLGLETDVVWDVAWLPRSRALCAGTGQGLYCSVEGGLRGPLVSSEIYFAIETPNGIVAGGWPDLFFGRTNVAEFAHVMRSPRALSDAVVTDWATLVAGPGLLSSFDGGMSYSPVPAADFQPRALAAHGSRAYAAGGELGGFLARSEDGGQTWRRVEMPGSQPEVLLVPRARPDMVILGTHGDVRPGDAYFSLDGGGTWRALGCPGAEVHALAMDGQFLYCGATSLWGTRGMWRLPLGVLGIGGGSLAI